MQGNRHFCLFFLFALIFSCEEEEVSLLTYPSVYHKSELESTGKLRVFSLAGEINNNSVINRFIQNDTSFYNYYFYYINNEHGIMDTVYFVDRQHARLSHQYTNMDCMPAMGRRNLILTQTDTASICCTYGEVFTRSFSYYLVRVKPEVHSEFIYSSTRGDYYFGFWGQRKYVFNESHGQLVAPMILYIKHSVNYYSGFENNFLQPDFYSNLAVGDTVTLMESVILLEK